MKKKESEYNFFWFFILVLSSGMAYVNFMIIQSTLGLLVTSYDIPLTKNTKQADWLYWFVQKKVLLQL